MHSPSDSTILEPPFHRTVRDDAEPTRSRPWRPLALRGDEEILVFGRCPVGSTRALAESLRRGGRVVAVEARPTASTEPVSDLPLERRSGPIRRALAHREWGRFDLVIARGLPVPGRDTARIVADLVRAARPGGRIALYEDRFPMLSPWPEVAGLQQSWDQYRATFHGGPPEVDLKAWLKAAGAVGVRGGLVASGGTAGDPRFDALVDYVGGLLREALPLPWIRGVDAALDALVRWRTRSDAALMALTRSAEGRRPPVEAFVGRG